MQNRSSAINIAIIGGDGRCKRVLQKAALNLEESGVSACFHAVSDPDPQSPGMAYASELGLITLTDYHDLYAPEYNIHFIIVNNPDPALFNDIIRTRPIHIRIMDFHIFNIFWEAMRSEGKKLKARNEEMKTILDGIQDFIMVINPDMEIVEVNGAFLTKLGVSSKETLGRKCYEVYRKDHKPCYEYDIPCPLVEVIKNKRQSRLVQPRSRKNGEVQYYEVNVYPVWEKEGKISKFIHISRDVTESKKEEREITRKLEKMVEERTRQLQETHEKLLHQDKMASLGKLSASVVHEINNPIAGILNLIMLMKRICGEGSVGKDETGMFAKYLNLMETETRRIGGIATNLLAFSRQSQMEEKPLDINRLLETILFMNSNLFKINNVKVVKKLAKDLPEIVGSEGQLKQVFMNFISNAVESMENEKEKAIGIETILSKDGEQLNIIVRDSGSGIPKENLSVLFEPFFTTKTQGKGIGLGLSVAYGIVNDHGGRIDVDSEVGKGSVFTISLPTKQDNKKE